MEVDFDLLEILDPLTSRQREFVVNVAMKNMGKSQAARAAGLSAVPKSDDVDNALRQLHIRNAAKFNVDLDYIVRGYMESVDVARANGEAQNMIAGYRELARITGLLEPDKTKIGNQVNILQITQDQLQSMSYNDLVALMPAELRKHLLDGGHPQLVRVIEHT